jgi:16S rRNA (guanine966-N2)-methyltransferase
LWVAQGASGSHRGRLRIIGGAWRSRRLEFPESPGLRPTPDRVRETVFNWLAPYLPGATCLDLFAGSGAFGFEALSRGAERVVFVEKNAEAVAALRRNGESLGTTQAEIVPADALVFLNGPVAAFDIVFLDPPYASGLLSPCLLRLAVGEWVKPGGLVYLETREGEAVVLPAGWRMLRNKTAGQVGYHLARKNENQETP